MDYSHLVSGTDIRGTAMGENAELDEEACAALAVSFLRLLKDRPTVAVGRDSRLSGQRLAAAVAAALKDAGATVLDMGLCSTPSVFMMTKLASCDGGIMVTASHHPADKNGLKFFTGAGGVGKAQLNEIVENAGDGVLRGGGQLIEGDYLSLYCDFIKDKIVYELGREALDGFKIVVDAGSGAAGFFATRILAPLKADVSASQFLEPDGRFPGHAPNPEDKQAIASISRRVVETGADLGVIFDTDGDRSAVVTADGTEINRNRLIAMAAAIVLEENPGAYIVTDSVTSDGLTKFIEDKGGKHIRYKRGYRNVIDFALKISGEEKFAPLAIETSGHAALAENYYLDDGAYLATLLIIRAARLKKENKTLLSLIEGLNEPLEEAEFRLRLSGPQWKKAGAEALQALTAKAADYRLCESYEGVRINADDYGGWVMARLSVHDPILPVNLESYRRGGGKKLAAIALDALKKVENIDLTPLTEYLQK